MMHVLAISKGLYKSALYGVSKLNRRLHRLVRVFTCQNATFLKIICRGSVYVVTFIMNLDKCN